MGQNICKNLKKEINRRLFEEFIPRIKKVLNLLELEEVWYQNNENTNSIGNLILHLCGNVTQWIGTGIGDFTDKREREKEFITNDKLSKSELLRRLHDLKPLIEDSLSKLNDAQLMSMISIQGYTETKLSIIIHVIEHFSYHTGQIALLGKLLKNQDLKFFEGKNLNIRS